MKLGYYLVFCISLSQSVNALSQYIDSVSMGSGYGNDVFYSLQNGIVTETSNKDWHIAFHTDTRSSTIITNDGAGVKLYTYPYSDTTGWDTLNISGMNDWKAQYNSPEDWLVGAFDRNALGHPDYGWGLYNQISHDVTGDSLFIIQLPDGSLKKLWIQRKHSVENTYYFRYSDLEGVNDTAVTLNCSPFVQKNFIYYSLDSHSILDREPDKSTWDILFTRYFDESIPYIVTGVLSNLGVEVSRQENADTSSSCFGTLEYIDHRAAIGSDWKEFNMGTFQYDLIDSLVFLIKDINQDIYKLYYTKFEGSSTGKTQFATRMISCATKVDFSYTHEIFRIYPNPADQVIYIDYDLPDRMSTRVQLFDLSGRMLYNSYVQNDPGLNQIQINTKSFDPGTYILRLANQKFRADQKVIIN